uniref:Uncharacterized protein n=1 Tax=Aegilops tauschii subsp. strangulata TaxID=200361 RepID=A0A453FGN7_AEGTS
CSGCTNTACVQPRDHPAEATLAIIFQSYMAFARKLAESLLDAGLDDTPARGIPKAIDPQLVYFMT